MILYLELRLVIGLTTVDPELLADWMIVQAVGSCGAVVAAVEDHGVAEL